MAYSIHYVGHEQSKKICSILGVYKPYCVKSVHIRTYSGLHFSRIWTEYGEIRSISPYSVQMRENVGKMRIRVTPNTEFS